MKRLANLFIVPLALLCWVIFPEFTGDSAAARSYYVSNQGNDGNDGQSQANPWKTIAKVNTFAFMPGDNVFLARGNVWHEELRPKASGLAGNPITFGSYGTGERPVLYGADAASGWSGYANNVYYKSGYGYEVNLVLFDGTLGHRQTALSAVDADKDWYWEDASDRLYIYCAGNPDDLYRAPGIEVGGARRSGIKLYYESANQQYLTFKDLTIRYANDSGMNFQGVNHLTIDNCTVEASGIKNIYVFDTDYFTLKNSSSFKALREHGLYISAGKDRSPAGDTCNYVSIENSQFYNNKMNGIQINPNNGPALNYVTINGCKIYDNYGHGILDMGSYGSTYSYNLVYDNGIGFNGTQIFLHYNELYYPKGQITTSNAKVYNNVIGAISRPTAYGVKVSKYVKNSEIKNNIFYWPNGVDRVVVVEPVAIKKTVLDYNCYYIPNSINNNFSWGKYWKKTLSEWKKVSGQDSHSLSADPAFVNVAEFDFSLAAASPGIDARVNIGLTRDYEKFPVPFGGAVDMGAFEYHGTGPNQVLGYSYEDTFTSGDYSQGKVAKRGLRRK